MSRENTKLGNCRLTTKGRVQELVIEESNFLILSIQENFHFVIVEKLRYIARQVNVRYCVVT